MSVGDECRTYGIYTTKFYLAIKMQSNFYVHINQGKNKEITER